MSEFYDGMFVGLIVGGAVGVAAMALIQNERQPDDEPEYWLEQLGRREEDRV